MTSQKTYDIVTTKILEALDQGIVPWRKPWRLQPGMFPINATTSQPYRGANTLILGMSVYQDCRWITYRQAQGLGGQVRKGEKATPVIFWKQAQVTDREAQDPDQKKNIPILRYYQVFNVEQVDQLNLPALAPPPEFQPIKRAEEIASNMPNRPAIHPDGGNRAYYLPSSDTIHLPPQTAFDTPDEFYSTLFHELGHSTGHQKRLHRPEVTEFSHFGTQKYSKEELVAEFTAAFLSQESGITNTLDNSAAYIGGWARKIKSDRRLVIQASSQGQRAADYILDRQTRPQQQND